MKISQRVAILKAYIIAASIQLQRHGLEKWLEALIRQDECMKIKQGQRSLQARPLRAMGEYVSKSYWQPSVVTG